MAFIVKKTIIILNFTFMAYHHLHTHTYTHRPTHTNTHVHTFLFCVSDNLVTILNYLLFYLSGRDISNSYKIFLNILNLFNSQLNAIYRYETTICFHLHSFCFYCFCFFGLFFSVFNNLHCDFHRYFKTKLRKKIQ